MSQLTYGNPKRFQTKWLSRDGLPLPFSAKSSWWSSIQVTTLLSFWDQDQTILYYLGLVSAPPQRTASPTEVVVHQQELKLEKLFASLEQDGTLTESTQKSASFRKPNQLSAAEANPAKFLPEGTLALRPRRALLWSFIIMVLYVHILVKPKQAPCSTDANVHPTCKYHPTCTSHM